MSLRRVLNRFLLWSVFACLAVSARASEYHGQVIFGGLPVPGSTVTVTATQGDKKVVAISDDQGVFSFADLADGTWTLTIQMTGFAPLKQDIAVAASAPAGSFELKLMSLDQIRAADKPIKVDPTQLATAAAPSAPSAATTAAATTAGKAAPAGAKGAATAKAGAKPGTPAAVAAGGAPDAPAPAQDATSAQANDGFLINGSVNNAATSQFSMNQAFGNNRNGGRSLYNGNAFLRLDNSTLDAAPYSVTGVPAVKPQFNNFTLGVNYGGPLKIPHLMPRGPYFGINYSRSQQSSVDTRSIIVPTGQDGLGNWNLTSATVSSIFAPADLATVAPACNTYLLGTGVTQTQINAGTAQFANNIIPVACVSHQAATLLTLYPQPNLTGNTLGYNYQLPLNTSTHSDQIGLNMNKQFGNKNSVSGNFQFGGSRSSNPSIFGFLDKSNSLSIGTNINWNHRFTQRLSGQLGYSFTRQRSQWTPFFANKNNIQATAGITGASTASNFWGPPSLGFSGGIAGLNDGVSSYNRNETNAVSAQFYWNKFRHNLKFGGDFKRLEFNYLTQSNPDGSLGFTGAATRFTPPCPTGTTPCPASVGGSDFADFLLGVPDTSNIAFGNADKYLRQSLYDAFFTDDFRVNPEFSVQVGVRWEYGSPITELKGRLVNLDIAPGFATASPVKASSPGALPTSLVHPDYSRPEPNVGIAWRPISGSSLLIRSGYQVSNDTSVYQSSAYAMAQQFPLSTSLSIQNSPACAFNMANPFVAPSCSTTLADNFAIDPNFKVGYVQAWYSSLERDLPYSLHATVTYNGIKGTHGVQEFLPNTCPPSATCAAAPSGYRYRTSGGNLAREAGSVELRRRLRNGFTARLLYTYAKSLDDDYSLSGQGSISGGGGIAQDWLHPEAQRGLSTSDQRHVLNFTAQYTTGMGLGGKALMSGWRGAIYKEWTIATSINAASGLPETVICQTCLPAGSGGIQSTVRANILGSPYAGAAAGFRLNTLNFAAPSGAWGFSRRNSIEGPDQFSMNANMNRTFRLHDRYTLDATLNATNILNHVVYSGWNTSWSPLNKSFGAPAGANGMRSISLAFRMRF
jgi:trimeric autotransporter adhesin